MYLNQPKPNVKAYFFTDRGALTLTNSNLGLIFQACLVEGFGDKESAGWRTVLADAQENKYLWPLPAAATMMVPLPAPNITGNPHETSHF